MIPGGLPERSSNTTKIETQVLKIFYVDYFVRKKF